MATKRPALPLTVSVLALWLGLGVSSFTAPARAQQAPAPDEPMLGDGVAEDPAAPVEETVEPIPVRTEPESPAPEEADPLFEGAPPMPTEEELRVLEDTDPRYARPILRRAARTAEDPSVRARALLLLARRDASRATARICARVLRIDPEPLVRRSAAECLGRLPQVYAAGQTAALVGALHDENVDVVTMAGWALANIGAPEALGPMAESVQHPDRRVGRLFLDYSDRLRSRHGLEWDRGFSASGGPSYRLVPPPASLVAQLGSVEVTAATGWLALYGGMAGWLHGGLLVTAFGGPSSAWPSPLPYLSAMAGGVAGMVAAGAYGFFRADDLVASHTVVQLGTFGTMVGFGAGVLSGFPPASGLNTAAWSFAGSGIGTALGVMLVETRKPSPGALAVGATAGFGTGVAFTALALSSRFTTGSAAAAGLLTGGVVGGLATVAVGPHEVGLLPCLGATLGGVTLATVMGVTMGAVESLQLNQIAEFPFTDGSGWAVAAGYATGAVAGGVGALFLPDSWDPLLGGQLQLHPPTVAMIQDVKNPRQPLPVAAMGGSW